MTGLVANKVVLVIGAGSGMGRATARLAHAEGAHVIVADLNGEAARHVASELTRAVPVCLDVANGDEVAQAFDTVVERFGRLDGMVNFAACPEPFTSLLEASEADFDRILTVNVKGTWHAMRAATAQMRKQGGTGSIVNIASTAGMRGDALMPIYSCSKHGVIGLTRSAALEFAKTGPRINVVCPGFVETPMFAFVTSDERTHKAFTKAQPMGRFGKPEEIAEACVWLLSDRSSLVNGAVWGVDGGLSA